MALGVVYTTSMSRPDAALALAVLYGLEARRESRVGAVCVAGAGLDTAVYCDIVARYYRPTRGNGNSALAVGLDALDDLPADAPMIRRALGRTNDKGGPAYLRTIERIGDTSLAESVLRNGITLNAETAVVLSAPATPLARSLEITGSREIYAGRVKRLVIVDSEHATDDPEALARIADDWPGPIVLCGRDIGEALPLPTLELDRAFSSASAHPVVDAYRSYRPTPYDVAGLDLAAVHFAAQPASGLFELSDGGRLSVSPTGALELVPGRGNARQLRMNPARAGEIIDALIAAAAMR